MAFLLLVILFVAVPIAEISLLIRVGGAIGLLSTLVFVVFTAILGAYLVRQQGFAVITKVQEETNAGRMPALQIAEGVALLFAGAVLLTPGFITDVIGFALLIPPIRQAIIGWITSRSISGPINFTFTQHGAGPPGPHISPDVIEGEYSEPKERK
ncbi:MAG: UPF0716 protein FxsA [Cryomorphaceae bacterium]|jgi:UPF0716 protein FxsA